MTPQLMLVGAILIQIAAGHSKISFSGMSRSRESSVSMYWFSLCLNIAGVKFSMPWTGCPEVVPSASAVTASITQSSQFTTPPNSCFLD